MGISAIIYESDSSQAVENAVPETHDVMSMSKKYHHRVTERIAQANMGEIIQANFTQQKIYPQK